MFSCCYLLDRNWKITDIYSKEDFVLVWLNNQNKEQFRKAPNQFGYRTNISFKMNFYK